MTKHITISLTSVTGLGELGIIQIMEHAFGVSDRTVVGFGDDVSAVQLPGGRIGVLKTDMFVASTDLPPGMTMRQAGWKAVVANVSDLAAKGISPMAGLVALGLPRSLNRTEVQEIAKGLSEAARSYDFPLIGGDTNESDDLTISIALFAVANRKSLILRKGAKVQDVVAVTGKFGSTLAGLKSVLEYRIPCRKMPKSLYDALYRPRARLEVGLRLAASRAVTSSIDSSDGLAWSLHQLSESSRVGILIDDLPISKAAQDFAKRHRLRSRDLALYGGEEYELVVTIPAEKFSRACRAARGNLVRIGFVTNKFRGVRMKVNSDIVPVKRKGWEHFRS
jgi:thiamine-monophosphate kinase